METGIRSIIESLLFVSGEPMSFTKLSKVTGAAENTIHQEAAVLAEEYATRSGGLRIVIDSGKMQMVTAGENAPAVEKLLKLDIEGELSRSALETISIVAYRGPLSRAEIEEIRGVNTSFILRQLAIRGLVEKIDNPNDARSYLYRISFDFLRHLGVEKAEDLPSYKELREKELISEQLVKNSTEPSMQAAGEEEEVGGRTEVDDDNDSEAEDEDDKEDDSENNNEDNNPLQQ
jgi:segregation and condensation protein B